MYPESQSISPGKSDIKLIVLDIDGTISGSSNIVSKNVKQTIQAAQNKGVKVALATGRMYCSALRFYEEIDCNLPLIAYQGAWIQNPHNNKIYQHLSVRRDIAIKLLDYFEQPELSQILSVHFYIQDELVVRELTPETQRYAKRCQVTPKAVGDLRLALDNEPTKILALCQDTKIIDELLDHFRTQYSPTELYLTKSVATFFEAANPSVNKGLAIKYLAREILNIPQENIMAVGDNFNDLEMLQYAGIGIAMGNAPREVKAHAQWVAPTVDEDGVAVAINKFVL
ncbi:MAG: Cof-type HAD-IIB family hydrolase [Cyanobacteria bacterium P01_A01_bin.45]